MKCQLLEQHEAKNKCSVCIIHVDKLTAEEHLCALYIANQVCFITKFMSARTHNIITACYTNELAAVFH